MDLVHFAVRVGEKTYNSGDSLVVTDPTTNPPLTGLSMGERTGSRVLQWVWSKHSTYRRPWLQIKHFWFLINATLQLHGRGIFITPSPTAEVWLDSANHPAND
ncbi:hypothetical protein CEP54_010471 [Fusarium duplospermum]|uniref:Uncharacterized protein n=1 Tax=Fusarium duplospermum TaxID=1325734 RepID=A0A428PK51_9HYPO|nr:hypothetical protein CEP54_010471 [Fusarium duplospermum]